MNKSKCKLRKGDKVKVIAGKDKGHEGNILKVVYNAARNDYWVLVSGANMQTHFIKADPQRNITGGKELKEGIIHNSNVALVDSNNKPSKVGYKLSEDGSKTRFLKTTGETVVASAS